MTARFVIPTALGLFAVGVLAAPALALPDAAITRITVGGADLRDGDRAPVTVEVANRGDEPLPPAPVVLTIDDETYAEWKPLAQGYPAAPIAPGTSVIWSLVWVATRGSHLVVATADPLDDVVESDKANNSAFVNVGVGEAGEPSPWPVALIGMAALLVGFGAAVAVNRLWPGPRPGDRYAVRRQRNPQQPPKGGAR